MSATISEDSYKVIMGRDVISSLGLIIDFNHGRLLWDELELNLACKALQNQELHEHSSSALLSLALCQDLPTPSHLVKMLNPFHPNHLVSLLFMLKQSKPK
jgi:hypothetical protein